GALVGPDAGDHLLYVVAGEAGTILRALARRPPVCFHFNPYRHGQGIRVTSGIAGQLAHLLTPCTELLGGHARGMPAITHGGGTAPGPWTGTTDPQRDMWFLQRLGGELEVREVPTTSVIAGIWVGPQLLHNRDALVGERTALPEGHS